MKDEWVELARIGCDMIDFARDCQVTFTPGKLLLRALQRGEERGMAERALRILIERRQIRLDKYGNVEPLR